MGAARRQFREDVEAEIMRRMREEHKDHIYRAEVEEIGKRSNLGGEEVAREFLRLAETTWIGQITITPEEGDPYRVFGPVRNPHWWVAHWWVAHFNVTWFRKRGLPLIP